MQPEFEDRYQRLDATLRDSNYEGWDPFDGLNSRIFQATPLAKSRFCRLAWLQLFKRSPLNFRQMAAVPKVENAKAMAVLARSYMLAKNRHAANYCLDRLLALRSPVRDWGECAWGYPFDWQAKAFFVPKGTPNVICTVYGVLALEQAEQQGLVGSAAPYIRQAGQFVRQHLWRDNAQGQYIAYIPGSEALVYNASLWGAYILVSAYQHSGDDSFLEPARAAIDNALTAQGEQGEWRYGTLPHHRFIDGFHTGYNLEALHRCNAVLQDNRITAAIERGRDYYLRHFLSEEGVAGYYHDNPYPIDPHSTAQWVVTLQRLKPPAYRELQAKALQAVSDRMWDEEKGVFHYQQHRLYRNRCCYLRWTQAWMHLALNIYRHAQ